MIDLAHFTPGTGLAGGLILGAGAAMLALLNGRVAGISGLLGALLAPRRGEVAWRLAFFAGLLGAPALAAVLDRGVVAEIAADWSEILVAGFLVGVGTRYAAGCTSGHGVCGLSRGSVRSLVATLTFMATGFLTVFVRRHLLGI
ncbi:YeeE/YedE family protein [Niveibacterium sp. SC-1]|uniref:YeeE/YedE family protein n=1 Tax=Niveibacterium sp. SC-1 TaxID=3135646 RepID=UPI00311ED14E